MASATATSNQSNEQLSDNLSTEPHGALDMGTVSAPAGDVSGTTAPTNEPVQEAITHIVTDVKDGKRLDAAGSESDEGTVKVEDDSSPPLGENVDGEKGLPAPALAPGDPGPPPDGGLTAWLQVLSNFLIHFFGVGFSNVMGVFIRYYYQTGFFGPNITQTSLALMGGVSQLVSFAFGPAIGILSDKFGYMPVSTIGSICFGIFTIIAGFSNGIFAVAFVFQGVLQGISFMASWIPSMGALSQWFGKRRGLAMAIGGAGSGLGGLALSSLTQFLLSTIGLQWTLVTMGASMLCFLVPSSLMIKTRMAAKRKGPIVDWAAFKNWKFVALWLACFLCYFAFPLPLFFLPSYASYQGVSNAEAALILGVTTAVSAPARIVLGIGMDKIGPVNIFTLACLVASICCFALAPFANNLGLLFLFAILYGSSGGAFMTYIPVCTASLFGVQTAASKLGVIYLSLAVGAMLGTFAGGQLITSNTYKPPDGGPEVIEYAPFWYFCGGMWAAGFLMLNWLRYLSLGWKMIGKV